MRGLLWGERREGRRQASPKYLCTCIPPTLGWGSSTSLHMDAQKHQCLISAWLLGSILCSGGLPRLPDASVKKRYLKRLCAPRTIWPCKRKRASVPTNIWPSPRSDLSLPNPTTRLIHPQNISELLQLDETAAKMGRWGMRLFEGDRDLDIALEINSAFGDSDDKDLHLSAMVNQTDMLAPAESKAFYETDEYKKQLEATVSDRRATLDSGVGNELFRIFRKKENEPNGKYQVIILGAIMMRAGAMIKNDDLNHLRGLVGDVTCRDGLTPALRGISGKPSALRLLAAGRDDTDNGFRHAGKVQFLTALDQYKPGVPRSFQEPR